MRKIISISAASVFFLAPFAWPQGPSVAAGSQGVIVSGKPAATAAGIKILEQGGNAADAGAATLLALSVTYVGAFCVGGEIPILVYSADHKTVKLLEGQGEAPRDPKAIAWYMQHGIPDGDVKAAAVPATIDAIVTLLKQILFNIGSIKHAHRSPMIFNVLTDSSQRLRAREIAD